MELAFRAGFACGLTLSNISDNRAPSERETVANTRTVPQSTTYENHPLASVSGLFADDPLWNEYLQAIREIEEEDETA